MSFFKFSSTDKKGNREVRFGYVDGIQDLFDVPKETVDVTIDKDAGKLSIKSAIVKNRIANLDLIKIKDVRDITSTEIQEINKSVIGRAAIGTLLAGPLGAMVGSVSGVGQKQRKVFHHFVVISYTPDLNSSEEKQIILEIVQASFGWKKFVDELPKDKNSKFVKSNNIEL